jgi:hypothetical protein
MKSIFDKGASQFFTKRIEQLESNMKPQWGKMNAYQMINHCILSERMYLGDKKYKRLFMGKLFGKMALKGILKENAPLKKNQPTHPTFKTIGDGKIEIIRNEWCTLIEAYTKREVGNNSNFEHPFFGKMTKEEIGISVFKHTDHHLRQFGV